MRFCILSTALPGELDLAAPHGCVKSKVLYTADLQKFAVACFSVFVRQGRARDDTCRRRSVWSNASVGCAAAGILMWWFRKSQSPVALPEPLSSEEQKRIKRKCVAPLKALQSCLRANPGLPLASKHLESRAIECFAEVTRKPRECGLRPSRCDAVICRHNTD